MLANRFIAVVDACSLVGVLSRNTLLSLAEADLFRARWSTKILDEFELAFTEIFDKNSIADATELANKQRQSIESAFPEAIVDEYESFAFPAEALPDPGDAHVIAAAIACDASIIVTENLKDFPPTLMQSIAIEVKAADSFIADTIDLSPANATRALKTMRNRFKNPALTPEKLLLTYESKG